MYQKIVAVMLWGGCLKSLMFYYFDLIKLFQTYYTYLNINYEMFCAHLQTRFKSL